MLYSGFESSVPSFIFPNLLNANTSANTTNRNIEIRYAQPNFSVKKLRALVDIFSKPLLSKIPQNTIIKVIANEIIKTELFPFFFLVFTFNTIFVLVLLFPITISSLKLE